MVSENRKKLKTWYAGAKMQQENYFKQENVVKQEKLNNENDIQLDN